MRKRVQCKTPYTNIDDTYDKHFRQDLFVCARRIYKRVARRVAVRKKKMVCVAPSFSIFILSHILYDILRFKSSFSLDDERLYRTRDGVRNSISVLKSDGGGNGGKYYVRARTLRAKN